MKCDVCGKEIEKGQEFHPAYIKDFQRVDGIVCSHECAIEFLNRGKDPTGYRVGEPEETNALKVIRFEVLELFNTHLLTDIGKAFNVAPTLDSIKHAITQRFGEDAMATWLCDSPAWAQKRYGPGEAYKVTVPEEAVVGSDLGADGKLWIWGKTTSNPRARDNEDLFKSLASEVPDVDDPRLINYWKTVDDKQIYIEGWCSKCFTGTGLGEYETQGKLNYAEDMTPMTLAKKAQEKGFRLIEGKFIETPDKDFVYGVTIGIFEVPSVERIHHSNLSENPFVEVRFLTDAPASTGLNGTQYGPYEKGHVYALPRANADFYVKRGQAEYVREEVTKPTLKELFTGATLESYLEAARVKPLLAKEMEKSAVEKWRLRVKAEGLVKEIREERAKRGL